MDTIHISSKSRGFCCGVWFMGLVLIGTLFSVRTSHAASVVELSLAELIKRADLVVLARVNSSQAEWSGPEGKSLVFTYTEAEVLDLYKGRASARVIIRTPGGSLGGYSFVVPGSPMLKPGHELVLFLRDTGKRRNSGPVFDLIGLEKSALPVIKIKEEFVIKVVQLKLKQSGEGSARAVWIRPDDLRIHVRAVMKNNSAREKSRQ